jgi:hypothetical protein
MRWSRYEESMKKPFRFSDCIYVKEITNDTLYCLNEQNELIPQFVFNLGKYAYDKEKRENLSLMEMSDGMIFIPHSQNMVGAKGRPSKMIFMQPAYRMKEDLTEEYFADREIKDPQAHQKLRELLKTLKDDDNPVVVVAKLK